MNYIIRFRSDAAEGRDHELQKDRRLHQADIQVVGQGIDMADIISLKLKADPDLIGEMLKHILNVGEGAGDQERTVYSIESMSVINMGRTRVTDQFDPTKADDMKMAKPSLIMKSSKQLSCFRRKEIYSVQCFRYHMCVCGDMPSAATVCNFRLHPPVAFSCFSANQ